MTQAQFTMGISAQQHRICTGLYCCYKLVSRGCVRNTGKCHGLSRQLFYILGVIFYFYLLIQMLFLVIDTNSNIVVPNFIDYRSNTNTALNSISLINLKTFVLLNLTLLRYLEGYECEDVYDTFNVIFKLLRRCFNKLKLIILRSIRCFVNYPSIYLLFYLFSMNRLIVVFTNPSIANPGPKKLSVLYNNVQGFVNTRDLASDSPPLNMTKGHEINGYIFTNRPDIILMNETWLKQSISSNQILHDNYKVFRVDRTLKSHPYDASRPKKFRKNGGGVLIAHKSDLNITSCKYSKVNVQAEILSVSFKTKCGKTFCLSTFYRVGTLGVDNFDEFNKHLTSLATSKKLGKHILIGDFNFPEVLWQDAATSCEFLSCMRSF